MKEYIIPIGVDSSNLGKGLSETIGVLEQIESKSGEVGKTIQENFNKGAKSGEDFDAKLKPVSKNLDAIREVGKRMGKELADAFKSGNATEMEAKVNSLKQKLSEITAKVDVKLDDQKIRIFEKEIEKAKDSIDELNIAMRIAKQVMSTMDVNSEEYEGLAQSIAFVESSMQEFEQTTLATTEKHKTLKQELRELQQEMMRMEMAGEADSQKFREMSIRAGELKDQIGDTAQQVKILSSDTAKFDALISGVQGLTGAFAVAQGTVGLFGAENEELEKALLRVNSAMAILQGLQAVANTLNKDSAFSVIFLRNAKIANAEATALETTAMGANTVAMTASTVATQLFSFALKTIGIGLIITAIAYLVEHWDDLTSSVKEFLPVGTDAGKVFDKIKSYAFGVGNAILQYVIAPIKALWVTLKTGDVGEGLKTYMDGMNVVKNYNSAFTQQEGRNADKYRNEQEQKNIDYAKRELERRKNRGEDVYNLEQRLTARQMALNKKMGKDNTDLQKNYEDASDKHYAEVQKKREADSKKAQEQAKRDAEQRKKNQEEAHKRALELEKKQNDQISKFTEELENSRISSMKDGYEKQKKEIERQYDNKISKLKEEKALTEEAQKIKDEAIINLEKEKGNRLADLQKKHDQDILALQLEAKKTLLDILEDSAQKEIELLNIEKTQRDEAIKEKYKDDLDLQTKLLENSAELLAKKTKEINEKYSEKQRKEDEEKELIAIELASKFADKSEETERQKQIAILQIKLKYAKINLDTLLASGKTENSLEVMNAKKVVNELSGALEEELSKGKPFDFFEFLGLGKGMTGKEKSAYKKAFSEIAKGVSELTEFLVEQYDRQIEKKQEVIDQLDNDIDNLEEKLDKEKDLREQGFANNVEVIEKELAEKQRQKDEEIKQQEALMKKKQELQKMQMLADTAMQLVNMITASTEIYKSLAPYGPFGIATAIATIAVMFGSFAASKVKAMQMVNDQRKMRKGGLITDSRTHEQGGKKFYSEDGDGWELENKEFVMPVDKTDKYFELLEAMRTGNFRNLNLSNAGVRELLNNLGFQTGEIHKANTLVEDFNLILSDKNLEQINDNIRYLVEQDKNTPKSWEDDAYFYIRVGKKTTKIPKKNDTEE